MFKVDRLGLDNLSGVSSLEKTDLPSLSSHYLPVVLYLMVESRENSPIYISMSTSVAILQVFVSAITLLRFPGYGILVIYRRHYSRCLWFSHYFCLYSLSCRCRGSAVVGPGKAGHLFVRCSLNIEQPWISE